MCPSHGSHAVGRPASPIPQSSAWGPGEVSPPGGRPPTSRPSLPAQALEANVAKPAFRGSTCPPLNRAPYMSPQNIAPMKGSSPEMGKKGDVSNHTKGKDRDPCRRKASETKQLLYPKGGAVLHRCLEQQKSAVYRKISRGLVVLTGLFPCK